MCTCIEGCRLLRVAVETGLYFIALKIEGVIFVSHFFLVKLDAKDT